MNVHGATNRTSAELVASRPTRSVIVALALGGVLAASGCRSSTEYGPCVGVTDDRDPALTYKVSTRNVVLGIVFVETIFAPLLVVLTEWTCPVWRKAVAK